MNIQISKKTKSRILTLIIICLIILILYAILRIGKKNKKVDSSSSLKEIVEYLGGEFYKQTNSEEEGYVKDVYISFQEDPVDKHGESMKTIYQSMIESIAVKMEKQSFRIIDKERDIVVRVNFDEDSLEYSINNDVSFFDNKSNEYQLNKVKTEEKLSNISIISDDLNKIINMSWNEADIKRIATLDRREGNYYIYKEGFKIQYLNSKVFNIIFTKDYMKDIARVNFQDRSSIMIKTGIDNTKIDFELIKKATYMPDDGVNVLGWENKDFYIFLSYGEVSLYRKEEYDENKNKQFGLLVDEFQKNRDVAEFANKLTDIYPDYAKYERKGDGIRIIYPTKGLEIVFGIDGKNSIYFYNNYKGYINSNNTMDNIKSSNELKFININKMENLVRNYELERYYAIRLKEIGWENS